MMMTLRCQAEFPVQRSVIPLAADADTISAGQPLEVTGRGYTAEGGQSSRVLRKATVPVVETTVCDEPDSDNGQIEEFTCCRRP